MSVGLICEFNPFHYGHRYIINKIKEIKNEPVICIMSGPFVQRGEPACANKFIRTRVALNNGADAVIQLPVKYSISAAENFARGGVEILKNIKGVSSLAFGIEADSADALYKIADLKNSPDTDEAIKSELDKGKSYPEAVSNAIKIVSHDNALYDLIKLPNNILAVEYIEALKGTGISALPIKRVGNNYNDKTLVDNFASATAIRENILNGINVEKYLPNDMYKACLEQSLDTKLFESLILYALRKLSIEQICELPDVECGLEHQIKKAAFMPSLNSALELLKSKRYTYARLKRIFLYALLAIDKQVMSDINNTNTRVLGIKKEFKPYLANLNSKIITRNSEADLAFKENKNIKIDAFADDIYSLLTNSSGNNYYKTPMIIIV